MKLKKGAFITMFCFAAACAVLATLLSFPGVLFDKSPVRIAQPFSITEAADETNTYIWHGAIKNESDSTVKVHDLIVEVRAADGQTLTVKDWFVKSGSVVLQPGEEYSLEGLRTHIDGDPESVKGVSADVSKVGTVYRNTYRMFGFSFQPSAGAIVVYLLAAFFAFCGVLFLKGAFTQVKRHREMCAFAQTKEGATFLNGYAGQQGSVGKAVGKSILSVLGGALSAIFLGVGFYKIHSAHGYTKKEFIVTKDTLYICAPKTRPDWNAMQPIPAHEFAACTVSTEKKHVLLTDSRMALMFRASENDLDAKGIADVLNRLIAAAQPQPFPETENGDGNVATEEKADNE